MPSIDLDIRTEGIGASMFPVLKRNRTQHRVTAGLRAIGFGLLAALCLHLSTGQCAASTESDLSDCRSQDLDLNIPACTRIIGDSTTSDASRIEAYTLRAAAYLAQHSYVSAGNDFSAILKIDPKNISALAGRAIASFRRGNTDQAVQDFIAAKRLDPRTIDLLASSGDLKEIANLAARKPTPPPLAPDSAPEPPKPNCGPGTRLQDSTCVPITCPTGQRLEGNNCLPIACSPGSRLDATTSTCVPITCPTGQRLEGNNCVPVACGAGSRLDASTSTCVPIRCQSGERLEGNSCLPIACGVGTQWDASTSTCIPMRCPNGQRLEGNNCPPTACGTGFRSNGTACVPINCPMGERLDGNRCVAIVCGNGQTLIGNACVAQERYLALAIGETNRLGYGSVWNRDSMDQAKNDALARCRDQIPDGKCKIIHAVSGKACGALAWVNPGTGWGAATRVSKEEAKSAAITNCQKANKALKCVLAGSWCND
jgi:hypothetical protein